MKIEQYVMAYGVEQDRLRALLPEGFVSLRPVLRINAEIIEEKSACLEFNTPAEKDNDGCYYKAGNEYTLKKAEVITANKEFCDCTFQWNYNKGAFGQSIGKTLPAKWTESKIVYPKIECNVENAAIISCEQVLGSYVVEFERTPE